MYLKRLELQGFKSFADKTILEFMPGITTVIGPNGSGKSNISDAIRWVLGEQSMKSLRGSKAEDIIFAGTQNRKSLGFAEASLVFDNSDTKLPIEYTEVTVTRKLYRSGETGYFINKIPCRLKDILELFMDTGIGKDGYSIIGQGKIEEILSNKSEDRRHIFEEAAGIVKYRARKEESEKKLEQSKLNLLRVNDIISEIESNIDPLKAQSEKAKQYLELKQQLKEKEVGLFVYQIQNNKEKINQVEEEESIFSNQNQEATAKMEQVAKQKEEIKEKIDTITNQIEQMQQLGFEGEKQKEKRNADIKIAQERIENNKQNNSRFETEIQQLQEKTQELEQEKQGKQDKKQNLAKNKEKYQKELEEKEKELQRLTQNLSEKEKEVEGKKQQVQQATDRKYELSNLISTQQANEENIIKIEKNLKVEMQNVISELDEARMVKQDIATIFYQIEAKQKETSKSLEQINEKRKESTTVIKQYEDQISRKQYEIRMQEARYKFLKETEKEKEGYTKSVKTLLLDCEKDENLAKGVCGVLANLITVPKQYETAIEMALGASLQNIVTQEEQVAKKLIEHLRKHNLGRASFLPISTVKGKKVDNMIQKGLNGVLGIASDLIQYEKKYESILWNLLRKDCYCR